MTDLDIDNTSQKPSESEEGGSQFDTRKLILGVKRHVLIIICCMILCAIAGARFSYTSMTTYTASAVLLYHEDLPKDLPGSITLNIPSQSTATQLITMNANIEGVIAQLGLALKPRELLKMVQVPASAANSTLIYINCTNKNPHLAVEIPNTLAKVAVKRSQDLYAQQLQKELNNFTSQLTEGNGRLNKALGEIEDFKRTHQYFEMTADYGLLITQLSDIRAKLQNATLQYNSLLIEFEYMKQSVLHLQGSSQENVTEKNNIEDPAYKIKLLQQELSAAEAKYAPENPKIKILKDHLKELNEKYPNASETKNVQSPKSKERLELELVKMEGKVRGAKKTKDDLEAILMNLQKQLETLPENQIVLVKLLKSKELAEDQVDFLNKSIRTIQLMLNVPTGSLDLYELADKAKPLKEAPMVFVFPFFGLIGGVFVGIALAILLEIKDDKIRTLAQVKMSFDIPSLLFIPEFTHYNKQNGFKKMLYFTRNLVERIEHLKHVLKLEKNCISICLTSSIVNEGKSSIAHNLALYYQKLGKKVVLIEFDSSHNSFDSITNYIPLEKYFDDEATFDQIVFSEEFDHIKVAEKGNLLKESIKSPKMAFLIEKMKQKYEIIIMDLPGVIETDYTTNLTNMADIKLFVIGSKVASKKIIEECLRDLLISKTKPHGIILTRVLPVYIGDIRFQQEFKSTQTSIWDDFSIKKIFRFKSSKRKTVNN